MKRLLLSFLFSVLCSLSLMAEEEASKIFYTTSDGMVIEPNTSALGAAIVGNTYVDGQGCITLDRQITSIGGFGYISTLISIIIPESVTGIAGEAFINCNALTNVTIPNGVTSIGSGAFKNCGLTSLDIPNSVKYINNNAFGGCSELTSITIPQSVTQISEKAFYACQGLTSITVEEGNSHYNSEGNCLIETATNTLLFGNKNSVIPNTVKKIAFGAFYFCPDLTSITIPESVIEIGGSAFAQTDLTSITIPRSVTKIGNEAFRECRNLTSITLPNGVTEIGQKAFLECSLTSIAIPKSVTKIGSEAFWCCGNLTSITVEAGNTEYNSDGDCNCLIETATNTLLRGCCNSVIPNTVVKIDMFAFMECSGLTSITIPSSVLRIGDSAFAMSDLKSIDIPNSVTYIGQKAFAGCYNLSNIIIPNSITTVEANSFYGCNNLTNITIPNSVTRIERSAFGDCPNLSNVTVAWTTPLSDIGSDPFDRIDLSKVTLHVPDGTADAYRTADVWKDFGKIETTTVTLETIKDAEGNSIEVKYSAETGKYKTEQSIKIAEAPFSSSKEFVAEADKVTLARTFTTGKPASVMLPFSVPVSQIAGATFYEFGGVAYNETTQAWEATMTEVANTGTLIGYKPYVVIPSAESITFGSSSQEVTFLATTIAAANMSNPNATGWTFKAVNEAKTWSPGDAEIGKAYGFAAAGHESEGITAGQFVKVAPGASIAPGRSYLVKNDGQPLTRAGEELPATIGIRFVSSSTTGIGTLDTESGEFIFEGWFDLQGLPVNEYKKGGLYLNKNKKVIVK